MELRQESTFVKANAIEKLAYLQMMGYDIAWASFNIIEVMASTKYTEKRIGYLAASQCFHEETDVLMLTTNMIRKDLHSASMYDTGVALGALSCFVTTDLARDLANDIVNLLSSSRPYIRKRAVLLLYKIFLKYPDSLRPTFHRLKERLEDQDPGVQSAAVNVICELARKNPKNYLTLAPVFFKLMTTSSNNWMLIKIIKLFGALVPLEPRLGKKLLEPLTNLINSTSAMSLLYECINTVIAVLISVSSGAPGDHTASIQLCVQKLGVLIEDSDQNLKYLGLLAMGRILQTHPKAVQAHKDIVLRCLDDKDESIRLRALDLLYGMVSKRNIMEIVRKLMEHVDAAEGSFYRDELLSRIISICSYNNYQYITNFEWYISVLVELTKVEGTKHGAMIAEQMQDVTVRVQSIRHFSVSQMALLVENANLLLAGSAQHRSNICEVLLAAAWICGEYAEHVCSVQGVLEAMLKTKTAVMPGHILSVYVQNIAKLYALLLQKAEAEEDWDTVESLDNLMLSKLPQFELADHLEAQERACTLMAIVRVVERFHANREKIADDFSKLFEGELNPVAPKAQRKVPVPEGLDLDAWIHEPEPEEDGEDVSSEDEGYRFGKKALRSEFATFGVRLRYSSEEEAAAKKSSQASKEPTEEEIRLRRERRQHEIENNPYYMKGDTKSMPPKRPSKFVGRSSMERGEATPVDLQSPLEIPGVVGLDRYMQQQQSTLTWKTAKKEKKKKGKKRRGARAMVSSSEDDDIPIVHQVNRADGEMPENAKSTDEESIPEKTDGMDAVYKALDIDLEEPLRPEEQVQAPQPYAQPRMVLRDVCHSAQQDGFVYNSAAMPLRVYNGLSASTTTNGHPVERTSKTKKTKTSKERTQKDGEKSRKKRISSKGDASLTRRTEAKLIEGTDEWLHSSEATEAAAKALNEAGKATRKAEKKSKDSKRKSKHAEMIEEPIDKDVYEVTSGVCTPSNPNVRGDSSSNGAVSPQGAITPDHYSKKDGSRSDIKLSSYAFLGESNDLKLTYETRVSTDDANQVAVGVVFANKGPNTIRQIEMNLVDTLNTRLIRDEGLSSMAAVPMAFQLPPGVSSEHVFRFSVRAINVSQKLRGTVTFFVEGNEGTSQDKVDFRILLPTIAFTVPATIGRDAFEVLLASGDVDFKVVHTILDITMLG
uniref:AP-3 complex subunit delta n=1 Tax=Ascaris suum TaxID=6253 RepID=F1KRT4_ASCSU